MRGPSNGGAFRSRLPVQQTQVYDGQAFHRRLHWRSGLGHPLLDLAAVLASAHVADEETRGSPGSVA
jgi:hypothetical protein